MIPQLTMCIVDRRRIAVTPTRFAASTIGIDAAAHLRDLVVGVFRILEHTPVQKLGINRDMHFKMRSEGDWHRVGHALAPKRRWEGLLESPGMRSVVMEGKRPDSPARYLRVHVEPSVRQLHGVYFATNEHFEVEEVAGGSRLMDILEEQWEDAQRFARDLAERLLRECLEDKT